MPITTRVKNSDSLNERSRGWPLLKEIAGGLEVVAEGEGEGDDQGYVVSSQPGLDVRADLVKKVIDGGFALRELRSLDMTLEDIFLRLTTEEVSA